MRTIRNILFLGVIYVTGCQTAPVSATGSYTDPKTGQTITIIVTPATTQASK